MNSSTADELLDDLCHALSLLDSKEQARAFLRDLCTPNELSALSERWRACQLLESGDLSYREIHHITGASLTTIGRVARFLRDEQHGGYKALLKKAKCIAGTKLC